MTSWIILLIKQYIDIAKYLLIGDAIFDLNNDLINHLTHVHSMVRIN